MKYINTFNENIQPHLKGHQFIKEDDLVKEIIDNIKDVSNVTKLKKYNTYKFNYKNFIAYVSDFTDVIMFKDIKDKEKTMSIMSNLVKDLYSKLNSKYNEK
jgi:hypothetical protein